MAVVYACFAVRSHFLSEAEEDLAYSGIMFSRASLCEILAMKLLGHFTSSQIRLVAALTASWSPLAGAPPEIVQGVKGIVGDDDMHDPQCALEVCQVECRKLSDLTMIESDGYCYRIQSFPFLSRRPNGCQ